MCGCGCGHVSLQMFLVHIPICCLVDTLERRWAPEYKWLHPVLVQYIFPCNNWHDFINWYKSKQQSKISMQPSNALHRQPIRCWLVQVTNCSYASLPWLGWKQPCPGQARAQVSVCWEDPVTAGIATAALQWENKCRWCSIHHWPWGVCGLLQPM